MVTKTQPPDFGEASFVVAYSDASDNFAAIRDLDQWARDNGFVRGSEYTLNVQQDVDGRRTYYGVCYRLTPANKAAAEADLDRISRRQAAMPITASSDVLLQDPN